MDCHDASRLHRSTPSTYGHQIIIASSSSKHLLCGFLSVTFYVYYVFVLFIRPHPMGVLYSYVGMRSVGLAQYAIRGGGGGVGTRPTINGNFTFLNGWLDQSWWPDGECVCPPRQCLIELETHCSLTSSFCSPTSCHILLLSGSDCPINGTCCQPVLTCDARHATDVKR